MVAVIDYRMGNLASVQNALAKAGSDSRIVSDPDELGKYDRAILPGVGAFGDAMAHLRQNGMDEAIRAFAASGKPMDDDRCRGSRSKIVSQCAGVG